jgi:hypothetical protein
LRRSLEILCCRHKGAVEAQPTGHLAHAGAIAMLEYPQPRVRRSQRALLPVPVDRPLNLQRAIDGEVRGLLLTLVPPLYAGAVYRGKKPPWPCPWPGGQ